MNSIDIFSLMKISNPKVIDIRDNYTYNLGTIPGAINVPYLFLVTNPDNYLNKNNRYYLLCDSGNSSLRCSLELLSKGYDVVNISGGYKEYLKYKKDL